MDRVMIRGFSARIRNLATKHDIDQVVSALCFKHLDPALKELTDIGNFQDKPKTAAITVRLDRQANTTDGAVNLQVQVNNAALAAVRRNQAEGTTIAQVLVPSEVVRAASTCHELGVRIHLENVVRSALLLSANSNGFQYRVERG
jgi:hypothetical protein